jgi:hypothetical protein
MIQIKRASSDRRSGNDRRRINYLRRFGYSGPDRRTLKKDRRSLLERRDGHVKIDKRSSVKARDFNPAKYLQTY